MYYTYCSRSQNDHGTGIPVPVCTKTVTNYLQYLVPWYQVLYIKIVNEYRYQLLLYKTETNLLVVASHATGIRIYV